MPDTAAPADALTPGDTADAPGDLSQGYSIEISCLPDGSYKVSGPEPLQAEASEEQGEPGSEQGDDFPTIGAALKQVLQLIKENPMSGDGNAQLEAGYAAR